MIIYDADNKILEIPFPATKYQEYITLLGNKPHLTYQEQRRLFVTAIDDFLSGKLSMDDLAAIAGHEWNKMPNKEKDTTDLGEALYAASELSYYVRHIEGETSKVFNRFMNTVMDYYHKFEMMRLQ